MRELLPGWRQQDLLGAARPGLLKKERKMSWRVNKDLKVRKKESKKNSQLPRNDMSKSLFIYLILILGIMSQDRKSRFLFTLYGFKCSFTQHFKHKNKGYSLYLAISLSLS